ncbi:hypothetical protein Ancab_036728 [Ancistrocladus abbreviatus]
MPSTRQFSRIFIVNKLAEREREREREREVIIWPMGNLLGIERMVESFWDDDPTAGQSLKHGVCQWEDHLRVKVRMTKRELKDLMAKLDITEDEDHHLKVDEGRNSELGRLIIKGGLEGRYQACVVMSPSEVALHPREPKQETLNRNDMILSTKKNS